MVGTVAGLVAAIGIGSNSTRLLIARREPDGNIVALERREAVTRLARYEMLSGQASDLSTEAIRDTLVAARDFALDARARHANLIGVVATEAVRAAANSANLTGPLERVLGIPVTVITGKEEAALGWQAVAGTYAGQGAYLGVIDIGGGSTDLSVGESGTVMPQAVKSIRVGSRTLMSHFGLDAAAPPGAMMPIMSALLVELTPQAMLLQPKPQVAVVIGGTASVLAAVRGLDGQDSPFERGWLMQFVDRMSVTGLDERVMLGVPHDRADVIVAGGAILLALLDAWGLKQCYASQRTILDGFIAGSAAGESSR